MHQTHSKRRDYLASRTAAIHDSRADHSGGQKHQTSSHNAAHVGCPLIDSAALENHIADALIQVDSAALEDHMDISASAGHADAILEAQESFPKNKRQPKSHDPINDVYSLPRK